MSNNIKTQALWALVRGADLRLLEKDTFLWVYAAGKKSGSHVQDALLEDGGVLGDSDGMEVNDAV